MSRRTEVLKRVEGLLEVGDTNAQIRELPGFASVLEEPGDPEEKLRAKAQFAQVALVLCELKRPAAFLSPYVNDDLSINEGHLRRLLDDEGCSSLVRGMVASAVANFTYRAGAAATGKAYGRVAAELLAQRVSGDDVQRELAARANDIWLSRLLWRIGERDEAEALLERTHNQLQQGLNRRSNVVGGLCLLTALTLDVWASFDWFRGRLKDAQHRIYRAISLLRSDLVNDRIRLGSGLLMAGRIEATHSVTGFAWARFLLDEAKEKFADAAEELFSPQALERFTPEERAPFEANGGRWCHPFGRRALVQQAQCLIKARELDEAEAVLGEADAYPVEDGREGGRSSAETTLARLWICERRAERNEKLWRDCVELARKLVERRDDLSERLKAEAYLHYGLCLTRLAGPHDYARLKEAGEQLGEAIEVASREGLAKIEAAAKFALAENLIASQERHEARERFEEARALKATLDSTLLDRIEKLVAEKLDCPQPIEVPPGLSFKEAKRAFMKQYFEHHADRAQTSEALFDAVGLSSASVYRYLRETGVKFTRGD